MQFQNLFELILFSVITSTDLYVFSVILHYWVIPRNGCRVYPFLKGDFKAKFFI